MSAQFTTLLPRVANTPISAPTGIKLPVNTIYTRIDPVSAITVANGSQKNGITGAVTNTAFSFDANGNIVFPSASSIWQVTGHLSVQLAAGTTTVGTLICGAADANIVYTRDVRIIPSSASGQISIPFSFMINPTAAASGLYFFLANNLSTSVTVQIAEAFICKLSNI